MLSGKGYKVFNVSGGIKAWNAKKAVGPQDLGLHMFTGREEPLEILRVACSLEQGLSEFYTTLEKEAKDQKVKELFARLAKIEIMHQRALHDAHNQISTEQISWEAFQDQVETTALEGGMSSQEYLDLFSPDLDSETEVVSLAMSIEAQALDLYQRLLMKTDNPESKKIIGQIADEEKAHIASLGKLMDSL